MELIAKEIKFYKEKINEKKGYIMDVNYYRRIYKFYHLEK